MSCPYEVLGVDKDCELSAIKKAYRKLSLQYHPDRNSTSEANEKMLQINAAYEEIGDVDQRKSYDNRVSNTHQGFQGFPQGFPQGFTQGFPQGFQGFTHHTGGMPQGFTHHTGGGMPQGFQGGGDDFMENIINMMFQGGGVHFSKQMNKPPPIIKNVSITLEQCYNGCLLPIVIEKWIIQDDMKVLKNETIHIDIPQGIDTNEFFVLRERGNEVNENLIGDVKIIVSIDKNDTFERCGMDLIFNKTITLKESLCGVSFEVKHLNGDNMCLMNNKNPTVIKPTLKKIINNMGMKRDEKVGNLIIIFDVEFPNELSQAQITALGNIL
jgi:DnaJ-class molecular chaperone